MTERSQTKGTSRASVKGSGDLSLEQILMDPVNLRFFKEFCIAEHSIENLLFWLEVADYKSIEAPEYRKFVAKKIVRKYITENAPHAISVQGGLNLKFKGNMQPEDCKNDIFDSLRDDVMASMKLDILPRFLDSPKYKDMVDLNFEQRKVATMSEFDLYRFLGAGGFGMVLLGKKKDNSRFYAIKVIDKRILISQNQSHSIFREKEVLACVEHPFIVALRYAFQTEDHLCLVLDYIEGGNMFSDLMRGPYTHERAVFYAAQIVLATQHLHELNILYRDLKPDNVLLTLDGHVKLADMGAARGISDDGTIDSGDSGTTTVSKTAKTVDPNRGRRMTITGTHGYRAPEVYERDYGKPADWWNVGILIIEMLTAENPLRGDNRRESEHLTKHKDLDGTLPAYMTPSAKSVALDLLNRDPKQRLACRAGGISELKSHKFFTLIDWEKLMAAEMKVPFEPDLEYEAPQRQQVPKDYQTQLDFFCQMVDYMKTSMSMRAQWPLKPDDQKGFEGFDFVSNKVFEEELVRALAEQESMGDMFAGASAGIKGLTIK
mmetsp:Transcript_35237/g.70245  ORF Transcript_35237/g.70245 Transcript_35237/m.70245 type:complete len:547 (-) Transcript_35237:609-2249(-)